MHLNSLMRLLAIFCTVSVFAVSSQTTTLDCEITISVNKNSTTSDWRPQYNRFRQGTNNTITLTFGNLQEVLSALNTTIFHRDSGCIEVTLSAGLYSIEQSVYLVQNIRIVAEDIGSVFVEFSNLTAPQNVSVFYAVTIFGAQFVKMRGIHFSQSVGIIAIEKVTNTTISDCSFMFFSRGAVDIYQSFLVQVHNCSFDSNGFEGVAKPDYQYRGHAGGLSIGFDDNHYNANGTDPNSVPNNRGIFITHCVFTNNTSDPRQVVSTSELLQSFVFTGRGGAMSITVDTRFSLDAIITDCVMDNNSAVSFGGGLYLGYSGHAAHTSTIDRTLFIKNQCVGPSGGLQLGFLEGADNGFTVRLVLLNSVFQENRAEFGGAVHLFANQSSSRDGAPQLSQVAYVENCTFTRNYAEEFGAAMALASLLFLVETSSVEPLIVVNCTFLDNFGGRAGVLSTAYLPLAFYGTNTFRNNSGRVLIISGTRVEIHGSLQFTSNFGSGLESGSLYITSFGQLQLFSGADVAFTNNSGIIGASIVVQDILGFVTAFSRILYNPLCVLRYENETARPHDWENVKISFSGNQALVASAVFHNNIDLCSWIGFGPQFFDRKEVFQWDFVSFSNDSVNRAHSSDENNPLWYVQTQAESLRADTPNVTAYPGQEIAVSMTGTDEYGLPIIVSVRLTDTTGEIDFSPSAASPDTVGTPSIVTQFSVANNTAMLPDSKIIQVTSIVTNTPLVVNITLRPLPCPVGHALKPSGSSGGQSSVCTCNDQENDHIMNCHQETLQLSNGRWGVGGIKEGETGDRLVTYVCPQHFCQCLRVTNISLELTCSFLFNPKLPDEQCICGRQGVLCGDCSDESAGFSALLSNCKTCGTVSLLYIIALLILDVLVIGGFLLFFKCSIHDWLYPTLFYLQVLPFLTFHFPVTFEVVHPYVYYVSSGLSFYFIYDFCLGPQFSALLVYFIRFIPSIVLILAACVVAIVRHCSHKKTVAPWPGLWLVALLMSTHTIHTSMSVLNCPYLPGHNGAAVSQRWYVNGNIKCFTNGHVPLALLSLAMLLLFLVLLPVAILYTTQCSKRYTYLLYNAVSPSSEAYKSKYAWWGAVELLRRGLLIVLTVALPGKEYWVIFSFSLIFGLYLFIQPYKSRSANIIEALLATNMMVLLLARSIDVYDSDIPQTYIVLKDYTADDCIDSAVHTITASNIFLLPGYYFPLVVFIFASMASAIFVLRSCCKKTKKSSADDSSIPLDAYRLINEDGSISTTIVSTDDLQVPLSRLLDNIYVNGQKPEFHSSVTVDRSRELKTTFESRSRTVSS